MKTAEENRIRVHKAPDGAIWTAAGRETPVRIAVDLQEFLSLDAWRAYPGIQLLGSSANAGTVVALWEHRRSTQRLQLATPRLCTTAAELRNPEIALWRMRQCLLSPSLGGFHTMTAADYATYRLGGLDDTAIPAAIQSHPLWPALSFLRPIDLVAAGRLLAAVGDPRWFVNPQRPDRLSRVQAYLGQVPGRCRTQVIAERAATVRRLWYADGKPEIAAPGAFIWRRFLAVGELRAGQTCVAYLVRAWHDALVQAQSPVRVDPLFDPSMLLPAEAGAYLAHVAAL